MGFVSDIVGSFTGSNQKEAARDASDAQVRATEKAIEFQREALGELRQDLQPFRQSGQQALDPLTGLVTDPNQRAQFIQEDPAIQAILGDTFNRINANQAARGKLGSGGTLEALQQNALTQAPALVNQRIGQLQNLATLGSNAAARTGNAALQTGANIGNLATQQGNAIAAGKIGAANAQAAGTQNLVDLGFKAAGFFF